MPFTLKENTLTPTILIAFRKAVGFSAVTEEQAATALRNGLFNVVVYDGGNPIGTGRLVGDGVMYWYLQDIIVLPAYHGKGVGRIIIEHLLSHIKTNRIPGTTVSVGVTSSKGKEPFYEKFGFGTLPSQSRGTGMLIRMSI